MKDFEFEGRVIFITEAARGIGRAMALELIARGASVASIDLRRNEADVDGLVCNAAVYAGLRLRRFEDIDPAEWNKVMAVNVRGVWATRRLSPSPQRRRSPERPVCCTTWLRRARVLAATRALARELGADGVRVNALAPGFTTSEGSEELAGQAMGKLGERVRVQRAIRRDLAPRDLVGAANSSSRRRRPSSRASCS